MSAVFGFILNDLNLTVRIILLDVGDSKLGEKGSLGNLVVQKKNLSVI